MGLRAAVVAAPLLLVATLAVVVLLRTSPVSDELQEERVSEYDMQNIKDLGKVEPKPGTNTIYVPPALPIERDPIKMLIGGSDGSQEADKKPKIPPQVKVKEEELNNLITMDRENQKQLRALREGLQYMDQENKKTLERTGEQLGALRRRMEDLVHDNIEMRKQTYILRKEPGYPGPRGVPGVDGRDGVSSVIGRGGLSGPPGARGVPGPSGHQGVRGPAGQAGFTGKRGPPGRPGKPGFQGVRGPPGIMGPYGGVGKPGSKGPPGPPGPPGPQGVEGAPGRNGGWKIVHPTQKKAMTIAAQTKKDLTSLTHATNHAMVKMLKTAEIKLLKDRIASEESEMKSLKAQKIAKLAAMKASKAEKLARDEVKRVKHDLDKWEIAEAEKVAKKEREDFMNDMPQ